VLLAFTLTAGSALAAEPAKAKGPSPEAQVQLALKAGPKSIADKAAVKDMSGKVLRAGSNGWTCYAEPEPMCNDGVWEKWMQAYMAKGPFKAEKVGLSYMLMGDVSAGASNTDPFASGPTADNQWVKEGPHVMILLPDPAMLDAFPTDPNSGGPYVMWKGTPYAHIMMPVGPRPKR
jgi:hypothetical protein